MGRYWLFLERVPGIELYQVGELTTWKRVAHWLALLHSRFAGRTEPLARAVPLLSYDGSLYRLWMRRAQEFSDEVESSQPKAVRRGIRWLAKRYDRVVERLLALPVTFIHGEFYASNVLVHNTTRSEEHTSELQSRQYLVCRLLLEQKTYKQACARSR